MPKRLHNVGMDKGNAIPERPLSGLIASLAAGRMLFAAARLQSLLGKANFNPNQPRVPKGRREGGQLTRDGSGVPSLPTPPPELMFDEDGRPLLPNERPEPSRVRNALSRQLAVWLLERAYDSPSVSVALAALQASHWIYENAPAIVSYLDRPKPLGELQRRARLAEKPAGYEVHHIVEQSAARRDGFPGSLVEGDTNVVLVPTYRHREITSWFMTANKKFDGLSPREFLKGASWEERMLVGLDALVQFGVLRP